MYHSGGGVDNGGGYAYVGKNAYGESQYFSLSYAVKLKTTLQKTIKKH